MKKILNLKVSAWPLIGIALVAGMVYSLVADAQVANVTLAQKQFNALIAAGAPVTVDNRYHLIAGWDGAVARPIRTDAGGGISTSPSGGGFTPADGVANPTGLTGSESFTMFWDGATWRRGRSDAGGNLLVSTFEGLKTSLATFQLNCGVSGAGTQLTSTPSKSVTITALAANTTPVYLGASAAACTTTGGYEVSQSASISESFDNANRVFCCSASGTQDISVFVTN